MPQTDRERTETYRARMRALGLRSVGMPVHPCTGHRLVKTEGISPACYLSRGKQDEPLRQFSDARYRDAKNDLAKVFPDRCLNSPWRTAPACSRW